MKTPSYHKIAKATVGIISIKIVLSVIIVIPTSIWIILRLANGAFQDQNQALVVKNKEKYWRTTKEVAQGQLTPNPVDYDSDYQLVGDMAMLSAIVYTKKNILNNRPIYNKAGDEYSRLVRRGWYPFTFTYTLVPPQKQEMLRGLVYDIWINEKIGSRPIVVFVFRGTDIFSLSDWIANLHPISHPITTILGKWDQYEQAAKLTKNLVKKLNDVYGGNQRMFATGHSLGGGLAQCARYNNPSIEKTFAFNSSPITDYHNAPDLVRQNNYQMRPTYMIYESNEVLAALRFVPAFINSFETRLNIVSVRYNFSEKQNSLLIVSQHSMQPLVAGLTK